MPMLSLCYRPVGSLTPFFAAGGFATPDNPRLGPSPPLSPACLDQLRRDGFLPTQSVRSYVGKPCPVCHDEFSENDAVIRLPCTEMHVFHEGCVMEWFRRGNRECPLCRADMENLVLGKAPSLGIGGWGGGEQQGLWAPVPAGAVLPVPDEENQENIEEEPPPSRRIVPDIS